MAPHIVMRLVAPLCLLAVSALVACKNVTTLSGSSGTGGAGATTSAGGGGTGGGLPEQKAERVDLLFAIDNSRSMADKQQTLVLALDDLISNLANPPCLDSNGNYVSQPGGLMPCPDGTSRQFQPVNDIHIGIVSSSLGGHGADACSTAGTGKASNNDRARLLAREDPTTLAPIATYQDLGFLAWDPTAALTPPGEADEGNLASRFKDMVLGVGQIGCGYEAQLESWYRFLVEPNPPATVAVDNTSQVVWQGTDTVLLEQRRAFLRPDSLLVVFLMTDENDCSIREEGQYYYVAQQKAGNGSAFHLPKARAICQTNPNDPCCISCGQESPVDENGDPICSADPSCLDNNGNVNYHSDLTDDINLRCFDQKRRFGIDFLYPIERYVGALTNSSVTDRNGEVVPNPIFSDLNPQDDITTIRTASLVLFAGVVGVPWQDIAKNPADLKQGFKTAGELTQPNSEGNTVWDIILGSPQNNVPPLDPFMLESFEPREGTNPITGTPTTPPKSGNENPINGHEYTISKRDDLQYACIMPLPMPRDCSLATEACDCSLTNDNPLCAPNPNDNNAPTLQVKAKAYPGLRHLSVLKGLGERAVIGSVCATQLDDPDLPDYAYRPVVASLLDRMRLRLK
ncbi:MAG: hypothetical protein IPK82_05075 [Polyangiaceae bacterium]|nr:hypothetical protein [Polyangiaceae bacterium]